MKRIEFPKKTPRQVRIIRLFQIGLLILVIYPFQASSQKSRSINLHDFRGNVPLNFEYDTITEVYNSYSIYGLLPNDVFQSPARFYRTIFLKTPDFVKSTFADVADFSFTTFIKGASYNQSVFQKDVTFEHSSFDSVTDFAGSRFMRSANFTYVNAGVLAFDYSHFQNDLNLNYSQCSLLSLVQSKVVGDWTLNNSIIDTCYLVSSDVAKNILFKSAKLKFLHIDDSRLRRIDFSKTEFKSGSRLLLSGLKDSTSITSYAAQLPDTIDIIGCSVLQGYFNFNNADFEEDKTKKRTHFFFLYKSDISKLKIDYIHFRFYFPDSAAFSDHTFHISTEDKEEAYESLLANFKNSQQIESYKNLDIEYQDFKWKNSWGKYFTWLPRVWWNYGYNKEYVFFWTPVFLLFFTIINTVFLNYLFKVYSFQSLDPDSLRRGKLSTRLSTRIWYSFIYTSIIFFRLTLTVDKINWKHRFGALYILIVYVLGLICLAYMANFVLQK